jgi:DNA-binding GntR family transcriptional regulator
VYHRHVRIPTRSQADVVARELQVEIVTGRIALGSRLRQEDLAARFGVSRTPIREALRQLQAIGLVDQLGHRGAIVRSLSPEACRQVFLVRAELEGLAAERAAGNLCDSHLADMASAQALLTVGLRRYEELDPIGDEERTVLGEQWSQGNELFHNVILDAAACPPLRETVHALQNSVPRTLAWRTFTADPSIIPRSVAEHEEVLAALVAPSAGRARRLMRRHVLATGETLARLLESQDAAAVG